MTATVSEIVLPALHPSQALVRDCTARFIVLLTGRRWGKTRLGAALCVSVALRGGRAWWIAPTYKMSRVGWRLLKALAVQIPGATVNKSDQYIEMPGGGSVQVRSGDDPDALRGEGLDYAVLDECAYMKSEVWTDAIRPALSDRKGRALFISTPRGGNWFAELYRGALEDATGEWAGFQFRTMDNPYIDQAEIEAASRDMPARLYRQEYDAAILDDVPGALWTRDMLDRLRLWEIPDDTELRRVGVAIDPAVTANDESDETGVIVGGVAHNGVAYIWEDLSGRYSPDGWGNRAADAYHRNSADFILGEVNNGGDMVKHVISTIDARVNFKGVRASRGKYTRAEPVAALYEQGKVHHVGAFTNLEDQLCTWVPGEASPDRLDALVWLLTELMLGNRGPRKAQTKRVL